MKKLLIIISCILLAACSKSISIEEALKDIYFEVSDIEVNVTISSSNNKVDFYYIINDEANYIKTVKTQNEVTVENVIFMKDNNYYLYQNNNTEVTVPLNEADALVFISNIKSDALKLNEYLNVNYDEVMYYEYSEEQIKFSDYRDNIFYDSIIVIKNNKLSELTQVYTKENVIYTVNMQINYDYTIPQIDL